MPLPDFHKAFFLPHEEDEHATLKEIEEGVYFHGHNLWLLVISMAIACVGLNINSSAAVIGAMLISPLMGPVVGIAFGLSTGNHFLLKKGLQNWLLMIVAALSSSALYFLISPFHEETTQLSGFKNATVFDCFLALLGGFAWFLGLMRKEAVKIIAGVAVSTACIPPLCTAGFGIATGSWDYFWGGFYFYLINCFFIGLGTWILSIALGYQRYFLRRHSNRSLAVLFTVLSVLMLIPSIIITKKEWEDENLSKRSEDYIKTIKNEHPELSILNYAPLQKGDKKFLKITLLNDSLSVSQSRLKAHDERIKDIGLIWQYAPGRSSKNAEIQQLQEQINQLQNDLRTVTAVESQTNTIAK